MIGIHPPLRGCRGGAETLVEPAAYLRYDAAPARFFLYRRYLVVCLISVFSCFLFRADITGAHCKSLLAGLLRRGIPI
jgi:hypothetical protein